ncbi:hypothetical protein V1477_005069 [Vespula maculifrons]|uniref:Uncharacterized protein n=2 Tax=Vespula TaxID=7451 RepID=A0A834KMK7_VESVU|nr:hypothetical protein HZH66_002146 [Vespula vulgaris]
MARSVRIERGGVVIDSSKHRWLRDYRVLRGTSRARGTRWQMRSRRVILHRYINALFEKAGGKNVGTQWREVGIETEKERMSTEGEDQSQGPGGAPRCIGNGGAAPLLLSSCFCADRCKGSSGVA